MIVDHLGGDDEKEIVTLNGVHEDDGALELEDDRWLIVAPGDRSTAVLWKPTATLEIGEADDEEFYLNVTLQGTNQTVRAQWDAGTEPRVSRGY